MIFNAYRNPDIDSIDLEIADGNTVISLVLTENQASDLANELIAALVK